MVRVTHVITGLDVGGAEMVLLRLLEGMDAIRFTNEVVCLTHEGPVASRIRELGVPVTSLALVFPRDAATGIAKVARLVRTHRADVVQTWMYHADLIGGSGARLAGVPVVWGLHNGSPPPRGQALLRGGVRAAAVLSRRLPAAVACCSETSYRVHVAAGYDTSKMTVIANGFAAQAEDPAARASVTAELALPPDAQIVVRPGRYHPQKDYRTLLAAAALVADARPSVVWVLCGQGIDDANDELVRLARTDLIGKQVRLLGPRTDVARLYAAADLVVSSSSYGEGLPLVLGEAMAAGLPAVATDVGDAAQVVGPAGRVVPPEDPQALAWAVLDVLSATPDEQGALRAAARRHIEENFGIARMVAAYEDLYLRIGAGVTSDHHP